MSRARDPTQSPAVQPDAAVVAYSSLETLDDSRRLERVDVVQDADFSRDSRFRFVFQDGTLWFVIHAVRMSRGWSTTGFTKPNRIPQSVRDPVRERVHADVDAWDELLPDGEHDWMEDCL